MGASSSKPAPLHACRDCFVVSMVVLDGAQLHSATQHAPLPPLAPMLMQLVNPLAAEWFEPTELADCLVPHWYHAVDATHFVGMASIPVGCASRLRRLRVDGNCSPQALLALRPREIEELHLRVPQCDVQPLLSQLPRLKALHLRYAQATELRINWRALQGLQILSIEDVVGKGGGRRPTFQSLTDETIRGIETLASLTQLDLHGTQVTSVNALAHAPALRKVNLCGSIVTSDGLRGLGQCTALESVDVSLCAEVDDVAFLVTCPRLSVVNVVGTRVTTVVHLCTSLPSLKKLSLSCMRIQNAEAINARQDLNVEILMDADRTSSAVSDYDEEQVSAASMILPCCSGAVFRLMKPHSIEILSSTSLNRLKSLYLLGCDSVVDLSFLSTLPLLEELFLIGGGPNANQPCFCGVLRRCPKLQLLSVRSATQPSFLESVRELPALSTVQVLQQSTMKSLHCFNGCKQLTNLQIQGCPITNEGLSALQDVPQLRALSIHQSAHLTEISCLTRHPALFTVEISGTAVPLVQVAKVQARLRATDVTAWYFKSPPPVQ